jgi:hypothetical protein
MPLYVYQVVEADGSSGEVFEVLQGMNDPPLTHHPESGKPVERLLSAPNIAGLKSDMGPARLERLGFTQYKRSGKGTYEKTAGKGPDVITRG